MSKTKKNDSDKAPDPSDKAPGDTSTEPKPEKPPTLHDLRDSVCDALADSIDMFLEKPKAAALRDHVRALVKLERQLRDAE